MPALYYRNHYISVFQIPDKSGNSSCIACVEIRHKLEGSPSARLMLNGPFSTAHEASEHGFVMGKDGSMIGSLLMRILRHHAESHPKRPAIHGLSMLGAKVGSHRCQRDLHIWCPGALPERTGGYEVRAAKIFKIVCVGGAITDRTIEASAALIGATIKCRLGRSKI